ncbi:MULTISPECIES: hypothetical protein [unclassified Caulobacter]|uniref:hypothetical protein n=1 Tax=unclassified Caulobacter TaxID=2648921 RepID=UPI0006F43F23|nr:MULTISPECIES: hypothetical protein [unclassified Caulobacter]KQV55809.1 hypothetical protein ASC62_17945 [Caulobacter sp. Root342]KQV71017.1 hypothetical protein ASC70_05310 [Caulobacter sp. Root343]
MVEDSNVALSAEVAALRRQMAQLRAALVAVVAGGLLVGAVGAPEVVRARRIVLEDAEGRERIILDASGADTRPSLRFRSQSGATRLSLGEQPDPVIDGKAYPRLSPAWGMLIYDPAGDERGGFTYLDTGRSVISLDRRHGEGVYMTVNEKSGFAGVVANYDTGKVGDYAEGLRIGTLGNQAFAQASNRDATPAGAIVAGPGGKVRLTDVVQK